MLLVDPPYGVSYVGKTADALTIDNDDLDAAGLEGFLLALFGAALDRCRPGAPAYVFHADTLGVAFRRSFVDAGWLLKQVLVWVKDTFVLGRQDHHWQHEPILYGWAPGAAHTWLGGRTLTTLIEADRPKVSREHPTMKPVALLTPLIERSSRRGALILDTTAGSGSIAIACHATARRAAMVELDPTYADVICRRYQEHTGTVPILDATAEPVTFTDQEAAP